MKPYFISLLLLVAFTARSQVSGNIETNGAWYIDDNKIKLEQIEARNRIRFNNYLRFDYKHKNFTTGAQVESYAPKALLNYSPNFENANLGTFYINYRNDSVGLDVTLGHFYEQFGSGLTLRIWEDRQLGIANSIAGVKIKYTPASAFTITGLYGKQRNGLGFDFTDANLFGVNSDVEISTLFKSKKIFYGVGLSYVHRQYTDVLAGLSNSKFQTSTRANMIWKNFSIDFEYAFKSKDALAEFGIIRPELQFDGDAYLLNLAYTQKGFGITTNVRRLENFGIYSQRSLSTIYNEGILNYLPALTKQFDYSLTNIYVYAAQPNISFEPNRNKAGEIGGQVEVFYNFMKTTPLGGKYGTNISINYSQWHGLAGKYNAAERLYKADKLSLGEKYYHDASLEIRKKWNPNWTSIITYQNQYYNARYVEEATSEVNANTIVLDNIIRLNKSKVAKVQLQHQWADGLFKNWLAVQAEYNFNTQFSIFIIDLYNYGNDNKNDRIHYYNAGLAYKKGPFRIQSSYGRQRGGLICVGGVCRFVPQSAGLNASLSYSF